MKKVVSTLVFLMAVNMLLMADTLPIKNWMVSNVMNLQNPAFKDIKNVENDSFSNTDLLKFDHHAIDEFSFDNSTDKNSIQWSGLTFSEGNVLLNRNHEMPNQFLYLTSFLVLDQWTQIKLKASSSQLFRVWINGEEVFKKTSIEKNIEKAGSQTKELKLERGTHQIVVKSMITENDSNTWNGRFEVISDNDSLSTILHFTTQPNRIKTIQDVLTGKSSSNVNLSYSGKYYTIAHKNVGNKGKTLFRWIEIRTTENNQIVYRLNSNEVSQLQWLPASDRISYLSKADNNNELIIMNLSDLTINKLFSETNNFSSYQWAPNETYVIYSMYEKSKFEYKTTRQVMGMADRIPGYKTRSFLYKYDIQMTLKTRITYGSLSTYLNDISSDSKTIAFSTSKNDYTERPFSKQNMYLMDMKTLAVDTLWTDKRFAVNVSFSPDNKTLLCQGGPSAFGKIGENIGKHKIANNYDQQLYLYTIINQKVEPISLTFNPSISSAFWPQNSESIFIYALDKDSRGIFKYDLSTKKYTKITNNELYISSLNINQLGTKIAFEGNKTNSFPRYYLSDAEGKNLTCIDSSEHVKYANVDFGTTQEWNYKTKKGTDIQGRVYLPLHFDENKKYPVIVYYYGGTSPVGRTFAGRYPFNLWAGHDFIVYVLQPSGTTGYGQEFSSAHVNNWGITVADEIIESTKAFLKAHPYANADRVGCAGASYGGFMTMYLTTRTNIFRTAISHAGISSISSYWGAGYWGYAYSSEATADRYPWNSKEIYVNQSPLFNADKVTTPLLLITGDSDTNVPPVESYQFYTALKILGKEVELVTVKDADHHIVGFEHRVAWHNTIMAWWDRYLKDLPDWWFDIYPKKNY
ncbi:MAG: prolyl oligopeptidase family serine peptidase [Salinivirgaceae bacterium]|nr:prolyl oligopeptidase family serine peptidase [Salinivirgaceae bacterium]MDY0279322.1 prolyl oligopeptidase family serine peptidase [Salinivirgaceae bacterium]